MAGVTGPTFGLPGWRSPPPPGQCCDAHPDRPATVRVQGETDSFGAEYADLCADCAKQEAAGFGGECDWCKAVSDVLRPIRDPDEGMAGPVYYVCAECRLKQSAQLQAEWEQWQSERGDFDWPED